VACHLSGAAMRKPCECAKQRPPGSGKYLGLSPKSFKALLQEKQPAHDRPAEEWLRWAFAVVECMKCSNRFLVWKHRHKQHRLGEPLREVWIYRHSREVIYGPAAEALLLGERDCLPEGTVRKGMPRKPLHELPDGRLVSPKEEVEKEEEPRKIPRAFKGRVMEVDKYHELV